MISVNDRVRDCFAAMQSPYRSPSGRQAHFLIKGMTVPSELAQSAGGLAFIFSRAMCVQSSSFNVTAHDPLTFVVVAFFSWPWQSSRVACFLGAQYVWIPWCRYVMGSSHVCLIPSPHGESRADSPGATWRIVGKQEVTRFLPVMNQLKVTDLARHSDRTSLVCRRHIR